MPSLTTDQPTISNAETVGMFATSFYFDDDEQTSRLAEWFRALFVILPYHQRRQFPLTPIIEEENDDETESFTSPGPRNGG